MKNLFKLTFAMLFCFQFSIAQKKPSFGLALPTAKNLEEIPFMAGSSTKSLDAISIPVDYSKYLPPIQDQKDQSSCVALCLAYYLRSFQECVQTGCKFTTEENSLDKTKVFSPAFLYNTYKGVQRPLDCENGMAFADAFNIVKEKGYCFWSDFPYTGLPSSCYVDRVPKIPYSSKYANVGFARIPIDIMNIRKRLYQGYPVILGIKIDNRFFTDGKAAFKAKRSYIYKTNGTLSDYHAVLCVGFDDQKKLLKIANSHGVQWGDNGFFYLPYAFVDQTIRECYISWTINPNLFSTKLMVSKEDSVTNGIALKVGHIRSVNSINLGFLAQDTISDLSLIAFELEGDTSYVPLFDGESTKISGGNYAYLLSSDNSRDGQSDFSIEKLESSTDDNINKIEILMKSDVDKLKTLPKPSNKQRQFIREEIQYK
jgi:hypothetical protein